MKFILIDKDTKYERNNYGVMEPVCGDEGDKFDIMIIPGLAFDNNLNRLGYGRGYYDNYLKSHQTYKIGICFHEQLTNNLPYDKNDIKMDIVITD